MTTCKRVDIRALSIGLSLTFLFYALTYAYVGYNSAATIHNLEQNLPSVIVEISKIKNTHHKNDEPEIHNKFLIDGLSQKTSAGELPVIRGSDYLTSFRAYQTPYTFNQTNKKPIIAFLITDYGLAEKSSNRANNELPAEVSYMLSPYAHTPSKWIARAHEKGHEVWLNLPIQNEKSADLGPDTIFHHAALQHKQDKIYANLSKTLGYVGVAGFTDSSMEQAKDDFSKLFDEIYNRGLGYLELNPQAPKIISYQAFVKGAPYIKSDMEILGMTGDNSFEQLEEKLKNKNFVVAIIPNYTEAVKNLATWIEKIGKTDYQIVPVSAIYDLPKEKSESATELHQDDMVEPEAETSYSNDKETHH